MASLKSVIIGMIVGQMFAHSRILSIRSSSIGNSRFERPSAITEAQKNWGELSGTGKVKYHIEFEYVGVLLSYSFILGRCSSR